MNHRNLLLGLLLLLVLTTAAIAEEEKKSEASDASDFTLSLRVRWWMPLMNGAYQINKHDIEGSYANFVDDLDMDAKSLDPSTNRGGPDASLRVRLGGFNVGINYVGFNTGGRTLLEEELEIDVATFDKGEWIKSDLTLAFGRADIIWEALDLDILMVGFALGASYFDFTTDIIGKDSTTSADISISEAGNGFYPMIGAVAEIAVSYFEARAELYGMAGDFKAIGDIRLLHVDFAASAHLRPIKNFSFGLGFRVSHLDASAVNIWHGDPDPVRFTLYGFFFEIEFRV